MSKTREELLAERDAIDAQLATFHIEPSPAQRFVMERVGGHPSSATANHHRLDGIPGDCHVGVYVEEFHTSATVSATYEGLAILRALVELTEERLAGRDL